MKTPTPWARTPDIAITKTYNTLGATYNDPMVTYSGVVAGQNTGSDDTPTQWSDA